MPNVDIKTIVTYVQDFEKKVTELKRETDNLEKKKLNYQTDIEELSKEHKELKEKVGNLSATLAKEVEKATKDALEKLADAEDGAKAEKEKTAKNNAILIGKIADCDSKTKEIERLQKNLQVSIKEYENKSKGVDNIKDNLNGVVRVIKEMLE